MHVVLTKEETARFLAWRGINPETVCWQCHGTGRHNYSNTSTWWQRGMAGQAFTWDVCNICWGTGDQGSPGADLYRARHDLGHNIATAAMKLLCRSAGVEFHSEEMKTSVLALVEEIEKLARGRKPRGRWFYEIATGLARTLREGITTREQYAEIVKEHGGRP